MRDDLVSGYAAPDRSGRCIVSASEALIFQIQLQAVPLRHSFVLHHSTGHIQSAFSKYYIQAHRRRKPGQRGMHAQAGAPGQEAGTRKQNVGT